VREPDAALMTAAPDLLKALTMALGVITGDTMHKQGLIDALECGRAAIAKATA